MVKKICLSIVISGLFFSLVYFGPRNIERERNERRIVSSIINELDTGTVSSIRIEFENIYADQLITEKNEIQEFVEGFKRSDSNRRRLIGDRVNLTFNKTDGSKAEAKVIVNEYTALFYIKPNPNSSYGGVDDFKASVVIKNKINKLKK